LTFYFVESLYFCFILAQNMKIYFAFLFSLLFCTTLSAQNNLIDSLKLQLEKQTEDSTKLKIYGQLAQTYASNNQIHLALENVDKLIAVAQKIDKKTNVAKASHYKGNLQYVLGDYPSALQSYNQSLSIAEDIKDSLLVSSVLQGIGKLYELQRQFDKAMQYYQRSLKINQERGDSLKMSLDFNNIGNIYNLQENYEEALTYQMNALKIREKANKKGAMLYSYNDIGVIYSYKNDQKKALEYFLKAYNIAQEIEDKFFMTVGASNISGTYTLLGQPKEALEYGLLALERSKALNSKNGMVEAAQAVSSAYRLSKNFEKALAYQDTFLIYRDSVYNEEKLAEISKIETNFKVEQQKKENELLERKIREQKLWVAGVAVVAILLAILAVGLVRINQFRKRANDELTEKNEEINLQNEEIRQIADSLQEANQYIVSQSRIIEKKSEDLLANIQYAKRIQGAMLPFKELINRHLSDYFIFFKPRDIVSGDFYYFAEIPSSSPSGSHRIILAAVDCTGHGVSGALMSMISSQLLNEIVFVREIYEADKILNELHKGIRKALQQKETRTNDGMDLALCIIDKEKQEVEFAGAKNPLIYIQDNQLIEIKGYRIGIGGEQKEVERNFEKHLISFKDKPTTFYIFSDGFQDQFGGEEGRKFSRHRMRNLLLDIHALDMKAQEQTFIEQFEQWRGAQRQIDDLLVIGFKLG
jgi:tetratricopeptide (TPR) repeat protein/Na+-transporting methylmalonyl-CoA/oxaloacetate decarboxylase gamma subunit